MADTRIYALVDPRDDEIRYVGKTTCTLRQRLATHCRELNHTHKSHWVQSLMADGVTPEIFLLELVPDGSDWAARERHWIISLREEGCDLTNHMNGGEGDAADSNRRRWERMTEPEREACRDRLRAVRHLSKGMTGQRHSEAAKSLLSERRRGNQNAKGKTWRLSDETRQRMRDAWRRRRITQ